uniref:Uncharacterized protein n=1 Tax=Rhizophora mucronata TaxID=61149 RepID=A0A2P2QBL9_RHIMU
MVSHHDIFFFILNIFFGRLKKTGFLRSSKTLFVTIHLFHLVVVYSLTHILGDICGHLCEPQTATIKYLIFDMLWLWRYFIRQNMLK